MRNRNLHNLALSLCLVLGWQAAPARGQIVVPGADGSDGALTVVDNTTYVIDLSLASTGTWNGPNGSPGDGVYDANKFAVVFRYTSVNIPAGAIVKFKNHPSRAPVVWLVGGDPLNPNDGNVTIDGSVFLQATLNPVGPGEPGPGGFRGGSEDPANSFPGAGFGPGGGPLVGGVSKHGSYATLAANESTTYGNARIIPLIGGSGGAAGGVSGTGGGGAILIASTRTITLSNVSSKGIFADGLGNSVFSADGSGGAIRLITDMVTGTAGVLRAQGGNGGDGRIRIEANTITLADVGNPTASTDVPGTTAQIWPATGTPTVHAVSLGANSVPLDPRASLDFPNADVPISDPNPRTLTIEGHDFDPATWVVNVRVMPKNGQDFIVPATFMGGNQTLSTWTADLTLPNGFSAIQVRASAP